VVLEVDLAVAEEDLVVALGGGLQAAVVLVEVGK
jgi:hypothetical protein